ncbi:MAG TPA: peptide chain release factor 2 [Dehalococcoidia bacterium]|nr:peptide chain release factor 2 [Dehalococcoidia bacterium]
MSQSTSLERRTLADRDSLQQLKERISHALVRLDIASLEAEASALEAQSLQPDFWSDPQAAQSKMRRLASIKGTIDTWRGLERRVSEALDLYELAEAEGDREVLDHLDEEVAALAAELDKLEYELAFSGPYDERNAILAVHAGAGGTESQDWAQMLLRMYLRWAESHGFEAEVLDTTYGEEAGIKSATVEIRGKNAFGWLRSERGVHRLVRISPFDASKSRHTSFALVEVMPEANDEVEVNLDPNDLRIDIFHSSGHGGQNVQKVATAVRITHIPTGIVVTCQNERSQSRNKEFAMRVLEARLLERELERRAEEQAQIKGAHVEMGWGNQIRSYVLHPYKLVKDHRTGYETSNAAAVLDGDLDGFMHAYLRQTMGEKQPAGERA